MMGGDEGKSDQNEGNTLHGHQGVRRENVPGERKKKRRGHEFFGAEGVSSFCVEKTPGKQREFLSGAIP